jgi:hypothetical protein
VYTNKAGDIKTFEDTYLCERSSRGKPCSKLSRHRVGYHHQSVGFSDSASSLLSSSPITPTGSNSYISEPRQPSALSRRPSTRDGKIAVNPEIVIHFGSKDKKRRLSVSTSTQKAHNISSGSSAGYSDSEGSHTVRTGFQDEPYLPPYSPGTHLGTPRHGRFPSTGSITNSSGGTPSHISSDYDYDSTHSRGESSRPKPMVHNPNPTAGTRVLAGSPPSPYNTTTIAPNSAATRGQPSPDSLRGERSGSSRGSSRISTETDREYRRRREEERKYPDEAEDPARESARQVRFKDRDEARAEKRNGDVYVDKEKQRAEHREDKRRQREERSERETRREKVKQPTAAPRRQSRSRQSSVATAQEEERRRLMEAETYQMEGERLQAEARERDEEVERIREQQSNIDYYNTRGNPSTLPQHNTTSTASAFDRPSAPYKVNLVQPTAPRHDTSQRQHAPPPVSFFNGSRPEHRPRRPSSSHAERPSALHAERPSFPHTERPNPFAQSIPPPPADPWNTQPLRDALPSARHHEPRYSAQQQQAAENHARAQQASGNLNRAFGYGKYPPE